MTKHRPTLLIDVPRLVSYLVFFREICGALVASGVEVHVACSPAPLGDEEVAVAVDDVELHHIKFPRGRNPAAHLRAARALNQLVELFGPTSPSTRISHPRFLRPPRAHIAMACDARHISRSFISRDARLESRPAAHEETGRRAAFTRPCYCLLLPHVEPHLDVRNRGATC